MHNKLTLEDQLMAKSFELREYEFNKMFLQKQMSQKQISQIYHPATHHAATHHPVTHHPVTHHPATHHAAIYNAYTMECSDPGCDADTESNSEYDAELEKSYTVKHLRSLPPSIRAIILNILKQPTEKKYAQLCNCTEQEIKQIDEIADRFSMVHIDDKIIEICDDL